MQAMANELAGKVAIVTGAGSPIGLGRAMTLALVKAGARVGMLDVDQDNLERTANEMRDVGGPNCVLPLIADVSSAADAERMVQRTVAELGGLHVLVNNAGIAPRHTGLVKGEPSGFWEIPAEAW